MWVIFEGLDKSGKGTLEREFLKATNVKHIVVDRGPVGYMTFDEIFNRKDYTSDFKFASQAADIMEKSKDFMVVYCVANEDVVRKRLEEHGETCPYDYAKAQKLYNDNIQYFYRPEKMLELDTSSRTVSECVQMIIEKLEEVQSEL